MANPNLTDMIEEDAADLQFPKDCTLNTGMKHKTNHTFEIAVKKEEIFTSDSICCACKTTLVEPYIRCASCENVVLCPMCFSQGCEINNHRNDHDYTIVRSEFPLIENSGWTAKLELELLDHFVECGFGNWTDISRRMKVKCPDECKTHYMRHYVDEQSLPGLPKFKESGIFYAEPVPYIFKLHDLEEPPRFAPNTINSRLMAGYNAARSDFDVNFDNHAELLISELKYDEFSPDDEDYELGKSLQAAIVEAYNHRLRERMRRRKIIRNHGLVAFRRTMSWLHRYDSTITRALSERLLIYMQLTNGMEFDYIMEGLHRAGELKNYINKLIDFRKNGLKYFFSVPIFQKLTKLRLENEKERKQYLSNTEFSWKNTLPGCVASINVIAPPGVSQRKIPAPLQIQGLPGYEKLSQAEKDLCSTIRIIPSSYQDFKQLLIAENKKCGSLRLAQARVLLKIDVNKTRKIYDFLAEEGYINKPIQ